MPRRGIGERGMGGRGGRGEGERKGWWGQREGERGSNVDGRN